MLASKRRRRRKRVEPAQDLDLMPMINVFMSIIPLLLLSAVFIQLAVIPTSLPDVAAAAATSPDTTRLRVSIIVAADAYVVRADGVEPQTIARPPGASAAALLAARTQLQQALAAIVSAHPGEQQVRIVADPTTRYDEIIDVMDVSRAAGLPDAALADATQGGS